MAFGPPIFLNMDLNMTTDKSNPEPANVGSVTGVVIADGVDDEAVESNRRILEGPILLLVTGFAIFYSVFHLYTLNIAPLETWTFRIVHVCGASILGFLLFSGARFLSLIHISEPRRQAETSYAVFCLKKKSIPSSTR